VGLFALLVMGIGVVASARDRERAPNGAVKPALTIDAPVKSAPDTMLAIKGGRVMWMEVTAYCACRKCCGASAKGITASGRSVAYNRGKFVAADIGVLPFGTELRIPGYNDGQPVEVIDKGGAIKGNRLDVHFPSHRAALEWGRQWVPVVVNE
jgi:3D (Asp-Asp-Asp) domain-containing protein